MSAGSIVLHSWEDHALIDLPTMVDYVLTVTNQKQLYYIGHSQGTALGFASFTSNPELASKIRKFYALGPLINLHHTRGVFWIMGFVRPQLVVSETKQGMLVDKD